MIDLVLEETQSHHP